MTPVDLSTTVLRAVRRAVREDALRVPVPARVRVERTRPGGRGEYASAVALQLAGPAGIGAREVAAILRDRLTGTPGVAGVEITGPGFLNFTLDAGAGAAAHRDLVHRVRAEGERYGWSDALAGHPARLHHAHEVRAAVTADAVRRLLHTQGAPVHLSHDGGAPDPAWQRLGVSPDAYGRPEAEAAAQAAATPVRPVPAGHTAAELLRRLGPDATRWGLLRPAGHDHAPLGPELIVQTAANPLFRVRYAHARARAQRRGADRLGLTAAAPGEDIDTTGAAPLLTLLDAHPAVLAAAARQHAPDRLARHLEALAGAFFDFHDAAPPLPAGEEKPSAAHRSRLAIAEAAGTVLAGGLTLLGVSAPEHL
ncbi:MULTISPECIES: ArgS-related anticodon-binding protein NrtL [unclassified Streptomyces]|uniref:ArgS-related anticodon-binding protein NrtL n=1 Tax=unclassified Streptomyces TaxID=2593676 RepID=UPI000DAD6D97|nr:MULTISPECIES: DALR anticodon-binding domain-containing protein [unclassified Streptomyces]PZT76675.1 arginine--tRNA ligase [Streptomyces sp. AC1-42W]PZT79369.1 arginine--tRNA ligase [Streptomyces sp. AC1-42T]